MNTTENTTEKQKWIIDTDPGCDDMMALFYMMQRKDVDLEFLSLTEGNCVIKDVETNIKKIFKIINKTYPVYSGCARQLAKGSGNAYDYHFGDGLGNIDDIKNLSIDEFTINKGYSSVEIVKAVNKNPNTINLLLLGPLTNICAAYMLDPSIVNKFKSIVIMGGSYYLRGNVLPSTEFNFAYDYVATNLFLRKFKNLLITPWEPTEFLFFNTSDLDSAKDLITKQEGGYNERVYSFIKQIIEKYTRKRIGTQICDLYSIIAFFNLKSVKKFHTGVHDVVIDSDMLRGSFLLKEKDNCEKISYEELIKEYYLKGKCYKENHNIIVEEMYLDEIIKEFSIILRK